MSASRSVTRVLGAAAGVMLDRLFGESATSLHPLVHFGHFMNDFEEGNYRDSKLAGIAHALMGAVLGVGGGAAVQSTALATGLAVGGRALHAAAGDVSDALVRGDLAGAREAMPALVGRNASDLNEGQIARATVESVAENTVDAIVAPALWASFAGASGALGYRALNTMDAMVGHRSIRYSNYGWASARLDDVANWVPARCTAALVALVRPGAALDVHSAVTKQAPAHPSPNSGVAEAAFAAALGLQLGGRNHYEERVEDRPALGHGRSATPSDIARAVRLSRDVSTALVLALGVTGAAIWSTTR